MNTQAETHREGLRFKAQAEQRSEVMTNAPSLGRWFKGLNPEEG